MLPSLAANISILFLDRPFLERISAARRAGFDAVECWFPYDLPVPELRAALDGAGLPLTGVNTLPGDQEHGEWGISALPGREVEFQRSFDLALEYATALDIRTIHVMAGIVSAVDAAEARRTYLRNLETALRRAEGTGTTLLIEPLNARDRPGYLLRGSDQARALIEELGSPPQLRMLFDVYHLQIMEGDLITRLRRHLPLIGHIQIAAVPSRAEPDEGEIDFAELLAEVQRLGWSEPVGCEYAPRTTTEAGLGWRETLASRIAARPQRGSAPGTP